MLGKIKASKENLRMRGNGISENSRVDEGIAQNERVDPGCDVRVFGKFLCKVAPEWRTKQMNLIKMEIVD